MFDYSNLKTYSNIDLLLLHHQLRISYDKKSDYQNITKELLRRMKPEQKTCKLTEDRNWWKTGCGKSIEILHHGYIYCPYCGGLIEEVDES